MNARDIPQHLEKEFSVNARDENPSDSNGYV